MGTMNNPYIWVLLDAGETHELFAELNEATLTRLSSLFFETMEFEDDPESPKSEAEVKEMIIRNVIENEAHKGFFGAFELRRQELDTINDGKHILESPDFEPTRGIEIWEASRRIVMGCDMSYALDPIGYFSMQTDSPDLKEAEWRKIPLS